MRREATERDEEGVIEMDEERVTESRGGEEERGSEREQREQERRESVGLIEAREILGKVIDEIGEECEESLDDGKRDGKAARPDDQEDVQTVEADDGVQSRDEEGEIQPQTRDGDDELAPNNACDEPGSRDEDNDVQRCNEELGISGDKASAEVTAFVRAHSSADTCLYALPEDDGLCGLWEGLVVSFDLLEPLAVKYANRRGEDIRIRVDRTGSQYQRIACIHSGRARRRVTNRVIRNRSTVRTNCKWGASVKVLNYHKINYGREGARPKALRGLYIVRIGCWNRRHTGRNPVRLLPGEKQQSMRLASEIAKLYGEEISCYYSSGVRTSQIQKVLKQKYLVNVELKGIHNAIRILYPAKERDAAMLVRAMQGYVEEGVLAPESGYGIDEEYGILNYA